VADSGAPILTIDTIISARCNQTGAIYVTATDVDASASYIWDSTITGKDLTDATPGNHSLVVNSNGCVAVLNTEIPYIAPKSQPLCIVTVDSATAANLVVWTKQDTTAVDHYNVYREGSRPGEYFLLGSRSIDSMTYLVDSSAYSWIRSYRYKISTVDKCGNESELSNLHKTVHLTVNLAYTTGTETKVNLIWDDYEGFDYTTFYVSEYSLHDGWKVLDSLPRDLHSYTTIVPDGGAIYVVTVKRPGEACWANRNYSGPYVQSYSNVDDLRANGGGSQDTTSDSTAISLLNNGIGNVELYPNPNDGSFTVTGNNIVAVDIYNANGQLIEQRHIASVNHLFVKPKAKLTEGIYFVKIITQNAIVVKKIMVE
jgi:fibronectin type 3 domain-containing protein